ARPTQVSEEVLINVTPRETRVAVVAAGVVQELLIERTSGRGLVGNIYMGRVARVLPGMQSAFIDVGLERAAFLHVADIWENREPGKPIEKILAQRALHDMVGAATARVLVDSRENYQKLAAFAQGYMPQLIARIEHYTGERPLFELYNVEDEIERALSRRVELKSGGYLIIDQTE